MLWAIRPWHVSNFMEEYYGSAKKRVMETLNFGVIVGIIGIIVTLICSFFIRRYRYQRSQKLSSHETEIEETEYHFILKRKRVRTRR